MVKTINMSAAFLAMACLLLATAQPGEALAAKQGKQAKHAGIAVTGKVVDSKGQPVSGAKVHFKHHKHKAHAAVAGNANKAAKQPKQPKAHRHHGVKTQADGSFTLHAKKAGAHEIVAHKKGAGRGHAKLAAGGKQAGNVVIHLHKHHRAHGGKTAKAAKH